MTRAVVAGATGYTGRSVVAELRARGVDTVAHVRPDSPRLVEWQRTFSAQGASVDSTPWDEARLAESLQRLRPDVVFALLGTTRARARAARRSTGAADSYQSVDYGLTALLLRAVLVSGVRARFVYLSAAGVRDDAAGAYYAARARAEAEIVSSGLPYTIARPSFITGADRGESRPGERLAAGVVDGALAVAGALGARRLRERYRSTSGHTLARALVGAALDEAAENQVLESERLRA